MRVISGSLKGRKINGYDIEGTRPTMDRVKESLFASIQNYVDRAVVLDLFAGSGNLGIEAISNGASKCYFVDNNKRCVKAIQSNVNHFQIEDCCVILGCDYHEALRNFRDQELKFDIIFIDPPYKYCIKDELMRLIVEYNLLSDDGIIVFEYQNQEEMVHDDSFDILKSKRYGDKYISIYGWNKHLDG